MINENIIITGYLSEIELYVLHKYSFFIYWKFKI